MTPAAIEFDIHVVAQARGRKTLRLGKAPNWPAGRVPRLARLMALAIHFDVFSRQGWCAQHPGRAAGAEHEQRDYFPTPSAFQRAMKYDKASTRGMT